MNTEIPSWVANYIGRPFSPDGDDLQTGINCYNIYRMMLKNARGIEIPSYAQMYIDSNDAEGVHKAIKFAEASGYWESVTTQELQVSDLVLVKWRGQPWHMGMYVGTRRGQKCMLHTNEGLSNSAIESIDGVKWVNNILGFWRFHNA